MCVKSRLQDWTRSLISKREQVPGSKTGLEEKKRKKIFFFFFFILPYKAQAAGSVESLAPGRSLLDWNTLSWITFVSKRMDFPVLDALLVPLSPLPETPETQHPPVVQQEPSPAYWPVSPAYQPVEFDTLPSPPQQMMQLVEDRYPEPPPKRRARPESRRRSSSQRSSRRHRQADPNTFTPRWTAAAPEWRPPYTRVASGRLEPHFHANSRAVLCIRDAGFTLTNGFISYASDHGPLHPTLVEHVLQLRVGKLILTEKATQLRWKMLLQQASASHAAHRVPTFLLEGGGGGVSPCPLCRASGCHRHAAVQGIRHVLRTDDDVEPIPHPVLRF